MYFKRRIFANSQEHEMYIMYPISEGYYPKSSENKLVLRVKAT